jgi:large subunit ribosomal protein L19
MRNRIMSLVEKSGVKENVTAFQVGDTVDVHVRILEGQKERVQVFNGTVISRRGGGMAEMFTVRRIVQGEGVERQFPINSPKIAKIEVKRTGKVRRAKLYYLRDRVGKATRLAEREDKAAKAAAAAKKAEKAAKRAEKAAQKEQAQAGS